MPRPAPLSLRLPEAEEARLRDHLKATGGALNRFVADAVREKLGREEATGNEPVFLTSQGAVIISRAMAMELQPLSLTTPAGMRWARLLAELRETREGGE